MAVSKGNTKVDSTDDVVVVIDESIFSTLSKINLDGKIKEKGKLKYLSWASAWSEIKKVYPDATYTIYPQIMDEFGNTRFWHDDSKTGWVEVGVTIKGVEMREVLAIMNYKNESIKADNITSVDANKAEKRCLVKACAMHGLGMYIYEGEDVPEEIKNLLKLQTEIAQLAKQRAALGAEAQAKVKSACVEAEKAAHPDWEESDITGNYKNIEDIDILAGLKKKLTAIRK